jgi:Na+/H+ antiporter NhaD/arsenite permease-like protein
VSLKTVGIAPKTIVATALPLVAGIVLALIDKLAAGDSIDDTIWWTLIGSSPLLGGGTYAAPAAPTAMRKVGKRGEAGLTFIEVILVLLVIVAVVLLIRIF